jgi:hypothetical protein
MHFLDTFTADFSGKHRAKSIPPVPHSFVAYVDPALMQHVLDFAGQQRKRTYIMTVRRMISWLL